MSHEAYGQCNTVGRQGDRFFIGGYTQGFLPEWDPSKPWGRTQREKTHCNPLSSSPALPRRSTALAGYSCTLTARRSFLGGGTPDYGFTGGSLLFWDREKRARVLLDGDTVFPRRILVPQSPPLYISSTDIRTR
jgi:hypothetical protein